MTAPPALVRAASVPWPLKPQASWHEVVGDLGEVRGAYDGEGRDHIHAGLDIRAYVGQTVVAVADEKVESPLPAWSFEGLSEGLRIDEMTYIHMQVGRAPTGEPLDPARFQILRDAAGKLLTVRVKRGTRFRVGDPLGFGQPHGARAPRAGTAGRAGEPHGLALPRPDRPSRRPRSTACRSSTGRDGP